MNLVKMGNPASLSLFVVLGREESVQMDKRGMDRCVKIFLDSYGIVVALVPSLYYSLF